VKPDLELIFFGVELVEAVPGRRDPLPADDGRAADESAVAVQGHGERPRHRPRQVAADDADLHLGHAGLLRVRNFGDGIVFADAFAVGFAVIVTLRDQSRVARL
jgi:hypothetical protein